LVRLALASCRRGFSHGPAGRAGDVSRIDAVVGALLLGATSLSALGALGALWRRHFAAARVAAGGQVTLILVGWSLAQYPNLVTPDVTVANACAPEATLRLLILALAAGALVLLPSLTFLFRLFKGNGNTAKKSLWASPRYRVCWCPQRSHCRSVCRLKPASDRHGLNA
jgi:hypothetical protein